MVGKAWTPEALFNEILKDKDFYSDSGGGITLSGGEPLLHADYLERFLPLVHNDRIHVAIETCGMFKWAEMEKIQRWIDLVYFDLKTIDKKMHVAFTGRGNGIILENFKKLSRGSVVLQTRMPVIPTLNDTRENIQDTILLLKENGFNSIYLVPYHSLGEAKLSRIKTELTPLRLPVKDHRYLEAIQKQFEKEGIDALVIE